MTVARIGGKLFVHSPVALDMPTRAALDALGPVAFVVAPSRFHHLYVRDFELVYPQAELHAAPGLAAKRPDVHFTATLGDAPAPGWAAEIDQLLFPIPFINEVVFCHRASGTLILTDLAFNMHQSDSLAARLVLQLDGAWDRFGVGHVEKLLFRDRAAGRAAIDRMLGWDFDRIVVAHGDVIESGGKQVLREAFAWLDA
jgi:hypothetical protein